LADGSDPIRLQPQGLTTTALMGELSPFVSLPVYQLALPFSPTQWRQMSLANHLAGTTF
jgi:hypothetical protein